MSDRKVFYPVKDVTLCGILSDAYVTLCGFSNVWAYREYITIQSGFILAAQMLLLGAIKELEIRGGVTLDASDVAVVATKNAKDLSADLILDVLMVTALRKTIELQSGLAVSGDVDYSADKWLPTINSELMFAGAIKDSFLVRCLDMKRGIKILPRLGDWSKTVELRCADLALQIGTELHLNLPKSAGDIHSGIALGAVMDIVARKYREVGDLGGMSFADVQDWNMRTFYYVEV